MIRHYWALVCSSAAYLRERITEKTTLGAVFVGLPACSQLEGWLRVVGVIFCIATALAPSPKGGTDGAIG